MSLDVKLDINAQQIEAMVCKAIIESSFGEKLKVAVELALTSLGSSYSYDNQLKLWVENHMQKIAMAYIQTNYAAQIEEQIKVWLVTTKMEEITKQVMDDVVKRLRIGK